MNKAGVNKTTVNQSLINGVPSDFLNVNDRSIHYGDGVFETILCHRQHIFYWQAHYQRLRVSAEKLKLHCPAEAVFLADIQKLLADTGLNETGLNEIGTNKNENYFVIKIILTRGESERGYFFPDNAVSNRIVLISALDASYSSLLSNKLLTGDLFLCEQQVSINKQLAGLKHLNRLENVMARNEWGIHSKEANIIDGLMLNANQHVIEGCMSNLFAVKNNELFTPDLSLSGVDGIMRQVIIGLADKLDIKLTILNLGKNEILAMDELFISNSVIGIKSVTALQYTTSEHTTLEHMNLEQTAYSQQAITKLIFDQLINTMNDHVHSVY